MSFLGLGIFSNAQTKDTIIDGKPFVIHTVEPRETLYGISRLYNAELNDLVVSNPIVIQGLQIGYKLLVPIRKTISEKKDLSILTPVNEDTFRINRYSKEKAHESLISNDSNRF